MLKSKSLCFKSFIDKIDDVLSKVHSKTIGGEPLQYNDDEWINAGNGGPDNSKWMDGGNGGRR